MAQYRQSGGHHLYSNGSAASSDQVSIGIRGNQQQHQHHKSGRARRSGRSDKNRAGGFPIRAVVAFLSLVLVVTVLAYCFISTDTREEVKDGRHLEQQQEEEEGEDVKNDTDFLANVTRTDAVKVLGFGKDSVGHGRDSRYWENDDRRRDEDYDEDDVEKKREVKVGKKKKKEKEEEDEEEEEGEKVSQGVVDGRGGVGLYNEDGRKELRMYEQEYEASLKDGQMPRRKGNGKNSLLDDEEQNEGGVSDNEYDDGIDSHDPRVEDDGDSELDVKVEDSEVGGGSHDEDDDGRGSSGVRDGESKDHSVVGKDVEETPVRQLGKGSSKSHILGGSDSNSRHVSTVGGESASKSRSDSKRKTRRRRFGKFPSYMHMDMFARIGSCTMKLLNSTAQLVEPFESRKFARFSLQYVEMEEKPGGQEKWEPRFAGHQSLQEREESFLVHDQKISCGFVKGPQGSPSTGFDLSEDDENYISKCHIAVVSCIFGNSDHLRSPANKMIGTQLRYSIWLDSKLRLQLDPLLVLEYFLWRKGYEYAISNHYDRHCVWEEVAQNKRLNKYNHTVIDEQFAFYRADGLTKFNASDPNKLLPSNVPEGSLIVRAHTPMSNLFSCLWFNEVEQFTPRDQLSFAYTYQKLKRMNPGRPFYLNMFKVKNLIELCLPKSVWKL
ncbi:hypothetical protein Tsubulata_018199 [Turnera subulata]|uniref:TOD1/MUCI70 glycosyltransferase-like domain-containing protein n=1 Tax=Turnera subulata TaxID=218843 RepID=A0A9Q0FA28_9ROSI|nr:hypothetical protein Tsubulata_018199 [Turnera subulata]